MIHPPTLRYERFLSHWRWALGIRILLLFSDFFNSSIIYGVRLGRGGKEVLIAWEFIFTSSLRKLKGTNLTTREVSLLEANSACGSVGYSFTIGIVSGCTFRVRVQIWPLTVNHISTFHHDSLFRLLQSSLKNSLSLPSSFLDRPYAHGDGENKKRKNLHL